MTSADYAADELDHWEQALRQQRRAEEELDTVRRERRLKRVIKLMRQVQELRTRADLLLAEAVKVKCSFTAQKLLTDWGRTTQPGALKDEESA